MIARGDDASDAALAADDRLGRAGRRDLARRRDHGGRLVWLVPPLLRALEYGAIIAIAAVSSEHAARRRLRADRARSPSATTTSSTACASAARRRRPGSPRSALGWDGRLVLVDRAAARRRAAGRLVRRRRACSASVFVGECVGRLGRRSPAPAGAWSTRRTRRTRTRDRDGAGGGRRASGCSR